ncbi:cytochrome c3 family protein [Maribacter sp. 4G9]|uniref:cytochrome c3 family protein n=1 Tax=Maribacter sp. 4G9 TaxID=1889777 RepID=UPI000F4FCCD5|nr:cytochrome c3 family protein [Maribacter sp. 4G9]
MKKKIFYVLGLLVIGFIAVKLYNYLSGPSQRYSDLKVIAYHYNGEGYVGSATCMECHKDIYESHLETAHFNTSTLTTIDNIHGSFNEGENTVSLMDADISIMVKNGKPFQHAQIKYGDHKVFDWSMDITIGSGLKGQSYLTNQPDGLFQLQASYFVPTDSWINSPNYTNRLNPLRPVNDQCLKCHVTFAKNSNENTNSNKYDISKIALGVDCEKCHGPAERHVRLQRKSNGILKDTTLIGLKSLSRQQRLDVCASCHSGLRSNQIQNPFKFLPGDTLSKFSKNFNSLRPSTSLDVHGNQFGLLTSSKCFTASEQMDCMTCHDPHRNQRGQKAYFNSRCITCHQQNKTTCSVSKSKMAAMNNDCIQCHMPVIPSKSMQVQLTKLDKATPIGVRTHNIAIYPEETTKD